MGSPFNEDVDDDWSERFEKGDDPQSEEEEDWQRRAHEDLGYDEEYDEDGVPLGEYD